MDNGQLGKKLGARIKKTRKELNITCAVLSDRCGLTLSSMWQIERGIRLPSLPSYLSICNALNVFPGYLLSECSEQNVQPNIIKLAQSLSPGEAKLAEAFIYTIRGHSDQHGVRTTPESQGECEE